MGQESDGNKRKEKNYSIQFNDELNKEIVRYLQYNKRSSSDFESTNSKINKDKKDSFVNSEKSTNAMLSLLNNIYKTNCHNLFDDNLTLFESLIEYDFIPQIIQDKINPYSYNENANYEKNKTIINNMKNFNEYNCFNTKYDELIELNSKKDDEWSNCFINNDYLRNSLDKNENENENIINIKLNISNDECTENINSNNFLGTDNGSLLKNKNNNDLNKSVTPEKKFNKKTNIDYRNKSADKKINKKKKNTQLNSNNLKIEDNKQDNEKRKMNINWNLFKNNNYEVNNIFTDTGNYDFINNHNIFDRNIFKENGKTDNLDNNNETVETKSTKRYKY